MLITLVHGFQQGLQFFGKSGITILTSQAGGLLKVREPQMTTRTGFAARLRGGLLLAAQSQHNVRDGNGLGPIQPGLGDASLAQVHFFHLFIDHNGHKGVRLVFTAHFALHGAIPFRKNSKLQIPRKYQSIEAN